VPGASRGDDRKLQLVASFYPLQWTAQQVAGDRGTVASLTKPGAEPHDLELSPRDVAAAADADLVIYLKGFQPAVDDAVGKEAGDHGFDVSPAADLNLRYTPIEDGQQHADEKGATDPHFWLDPIRLAAVAGAIAARLSQLDPTHANAYRANAATLTRTLRALDQDFTAGLAHCANPDLVTSHNAFGYLAQRYGMTQVGITGLTPEDEPKPGDLTAIAAFVEKHRVRTIYYETLVSPAIARTVAAETGAKTAVLDPIEGLTKDSQGSNYVQVMRANLANLEQGQACE
jgi:zinc transport system substrate-binding protein